jgi:hypothetical protein
MNKLVTTRRITRWLLLLQEFNITIVDRPKKENVVADFLSRIPQDSTSIPVNDNFSDEHLFAVAIKTPWFADTTNYLATRILPPHLSPPQKKRIVQQSAYYSWVGSDLFYTSPDMIIRRCVWEDEIPDILQAYHDGPCGGHLSDKRTAYKVLQPGYYWPTLFKDATKYVRSYDSCQRMGRPIVVDKMPLRPEVVIEPFDKWELDFVGPISPMSRKKK